jgi:hypothetical protein
MSKALLMRLIDQKGVSRLLFDPDLYQHFPALESVMLMRSKSTRF